jgi:NAD+ kinase
MLHAQVLAQDDGDGERAARHDALNDIVIGRVTLGRTVQVSLAVEGVLTAEFRADGVIVATATGSTGYSLSAGGPILPPESKDMLFTPLAPHLAARNSLVLPPDTTVEVRLAPGEQAAFSVDGEPDFDLNAGETVRVTQGPHTVRFLRLGPPTDLYERLARRLNWLQGEDAQSRLVLGEAPA